MLRRSGRGRLGHKQSGAEKVEELARPVGWSASPTPSDMRTGSKKRILFVSRDRKYLAKTEVILLSRDKQLEWRPARRVFFRTSQKETACSPRILWNVVRGN